MSLFAALASPMADGAVVLRAVDESDREPLRAACAADPELWPIYPISMVGDGFDPAFERLLASEPTRVSFVIAVDGRIVGFTSYFRVEDTNALAEIGWTYLVPTARGGAVNGTIKRLMLDRAFGAGVRRVEFRVDTRNTRSMRAVEKLGATLDGVLRRDRVTWTGHVRDTAVWSLLADEWPA